MTFYLKFEDFLVAYVGPFDSVALANEHLEKIAVREQDSDSTVSVVTVDQFLVDHQDGETVLSACDDLRSCTGCGRVMSESECGDVGPEELVCDGCSGCCF